MGGADRRFNRIGKNIFVRLIDKPLSAKIGKAGEKFLFHALSKEFLNF
jgi:hypothetical protein